MPNIICHDCGIERFVCHRVVCKDGYFRCTKCIKKKCYNIEETAKRWKNWIEANREEHNTKRKQKTVAKLLSNPFIINKNNNFYSIICCTCNNIFEKKHPKKTKDGKYRCEKCRKKLDDRKYGRSDKGKVAARKNQQKATKTPEGRKKRAIIANKRYWKDPDHYRLKNLSRQHGCEVGILKIVKERDQICQFCDTTENLTFDHIFPVSKGGKTTLENLQILCMSCNIFKRDHLLLADNQGIMF